MDRQEYIRYLDAANKRSSHGAERRRIMKLGICTSPLGHGNSARPFYNHARIGHWANAHNEPEKYDSQGFLKPGETGTFHIHTGVDCAGAYPTGEWTVFLNRSAMPGLVRVKGAARAVKGWEHLGGLFRWIINVDDATADGIQIRFVDGCEKPITYCGVFPGRHEVPPGQAWTPEALESFKGFNTIRFLNWAGINRRGELPEETYVWGKMPYTDTCSWATGLGGVPVEAQIALCQNVGARPWFCIPHMMSDADVKEFANFCVSLNVKPIIEHSNEVAFNIYDCAAYCQNEGVKLGLDEWPEKEPWGPYGARLLFNARRTYEIARIFREAGCACTVVLSAQHDNPGTSRFPLRWLRDYKMLGEIDAIATAPYIQKPTGDVLNEKTIFAAMLNDPDALPRTIARAKSHAQIAYEYGVKLFAYEFNEHLESTNPTLYNLYKWAARRPEMQAVIMTQVNALEQTGYDLVCAHCRCKGQSRNNFGFQACEGDIDAPKWKALLPWLEAEEPPVIAPPIPPAPEPSSVAEHLRTAGEALIAAAAAEGMEGMEGMEE